MIRTTVELARVVAGLVNTTQTENNVVVRRGMKIAGARHVLQGALTIAAPELRVLGVAADGLHALSMVAVAALSRRYRHPALAQAALAATFAVTETLVLRGAPAAPGRPRKLARGKA